MNKFDKLFNKIISEQSKKSKKNKIIKQAEENNDKFFQIFFNVLMTDILDLCENVRSWNYGTQTYDDIAKNFITDVFMEFEHDIFADVFDNIVSLEEFEMGTSDQQEQWLKQAIISGGWISKINQYAQNYDQKYLIDKGINPVNPEDNIEEIPEDFRLKEI